MTWIIAVQLLLGSGILLSLIRIAVLAGRYGERLDTVFDSHAKLQRNVTDISDRVIRVETNVEFIRKAVGLNGG